MTTAEDAYERLWRTNVPFPLKAGTWGVTPGSGFLGAVIRRATESPVGHALMYIGGGQIVQARYPKAEIAPAPIDNVLWAYGQPLTDNQRILVCEQARKEVGTPYDLIAYPMFAIALFNAGVLKQEALLLNHDYFRICSALVEDCDAAAGAPMTDLPDSNLVRPSDLFNVGVANSWFTERPI